MHIILEAAQTLEATFIYLCVRVSAPLLTMNKQKMKGDNEERLFHER